MRTEDETPRREAPVSYRPPKNLAAEFRRQVESSGLTANAYITRALFGEGAINGRRARRASLDQQAIARLLGEVAALKDLVRALEARARQDGIDAGKLDEAVSYLGEVRALCFKSLGRTP